MIINSSQQKRQRAGSRFWAALLTLSVAVAVFAGVRLALEMQDYGAAVKEYDGLRSLIENADAVSGSPSVPNAAPDTLHSALTSINPDYIGWLDIEGLDISYPVVLGQDNNKYLTTTFAGEQNKLGAIFMDYRCESGFGAPYAVLYGHNAKDGRMFASPSRLLESDAESYPAITVTLPDGTTIAYRIYAVKTTDINDPAYHAAFEGADALADFATPTGASSGTNILALSTCTNGQNRDERLLVLAEAI